MISKQDLEIMYQYYLKLTSDPNIDKQKFWVPIQDMKKDDLGNIVNIENEFYRYVIDYYGFNGFPVVISDEKYKEFDSPELFHGYTKMSHPASYLSHFKYHYGQGYISGFYSTNSFQNAKKYTVEDEVSLVPRSKQRVMKLKINPENVIGLGELRQLSKLIDRTLDCSDSEVFKRYHEYVYKIKLLRNFAYEKVQTERCLENAKGFLELFKNYSTLAVCLGIDTIIYKANNRLTYFIENDRSRVVVSESEAKRFMIKGKEMKDCSINLKSDNEADDIIYEKNERDIEKV